MLQVICTYNTVKVKMIKLHHTKCLGQSTRHFCYELFNRRATNYVEFTVWLLPICLGVGYSST